MSDTIDLIMKNLGDALGTVQKALALPKDEERIVVDATIQRFEYTFELFWKTMKRLQEKMGGEQVPLLKMVLQKAYQLGWIENEEIWLAMLEDRNMSSHVYKQASADEIYSHIGDYYIEMQRVYEKLKGIK